MSRPPDIGRVLLSLLSMAVAMSAVGGCGRAPDGPNEIPFQWHGATELEPELYRLDNGLTVILLESHSAPVVAAQAWVAVGSADERPEEAGLAHVHEHMLFKGTETRGVGEIASHVESAGGAINAWTSYDQTVYHIVIASRFSELGLSVLADAIQHSSFDADELARELEVIREEIKRSNDLPGRVVSRNLFDTAFEDHPYGLPIIGTEESVSSFSRDDVVSFYRRWYRPGNMTLVVVGDFDREEMRRQVESYFGDMPDGPVERPVRPTEPEQTGVRAVVATRDVQEGHLALGFHTPGLADTDVPALEVLVILLGQGESSLLFRELKRNRQLATDVYAYLYSPRDPGLLMAGANFRTGERPQDPMELLDGLLTQLFTLRHVPVSSEDLRRAKAILESETVYERETVQGRASRLGFFHVVAGDLRFERRFYDLVAQVSADDLLRVAETYLSPENLTVSWVVPEALQAELTEEAIAGRVEQTYAEVEQLSRLDPVEVDDNGIVRHTFPNGMTLLVQEDHSVPIVSVRAVYPGGLRFESEENNGINNFVSDLLTGGTASRTADEIAHEIESMAGSISGFSGRNSIGLQLTVLSRELEKALEILADCATNSVFPHAEVERVRHEILADIEAQRDDLAGSAFRQMNRTLFGEHPFGLDVLGRRETIEAMDDTDLRRFYEAHLHPSRMTMAVVGDVDAATVILAVSRLFDVGGERVELDVSVPSLVRRPREVVETHRDREQAHLVLGFQGVDLFSQDRWALEVMAAILSGQGGRLFYELRDRQSLAYSVAAFNVVGLDAGYFAHYIATSPEKVDEAVAGIEREIRRLQEEPVTSEELERAQRYLVGQRAISAQRTSNRAAFLAFDEAYGLGYDHHMRYADRILEVTPEDIQRVARRYLDLDEGVLSIVRPAGVAGDDGSGASGEE